eukprot:CAMPEP_0178458260 /NCGR_PEP_ID=MMETSP0689_2-20121128/47455_1 /TAXON_ID=160604 /ORGANISM="Amphidinium massartii, Strain CS-259" /LENGTH=40 /DNA_ID= /DNA_START= /DNA_END= /DNA_ORIENTATION=
MSANAASAASLLLVSCASSSRSFAAANWSENRSAQARFAS